MKKVTKRKGGARGGRKDASTSSAATATATQETQPSQETQPTQEVEPKVESPVVAEKGENEGDDEAKPDGDGDSSTQQQEKEGDEEAKPDAKDPSASKKDAASSSSSKPQAAEKKEEAEKAPLRRGKRQRTPSTDSEKKETPRAKRGKAAKQQEAHEPEYFKDKRSLEDLWKAAFPVGTEWGQLDELHEFEWDFTNLEEALQEGGNLYGKKVYVFGCTESQVVPDKKKNKTILVPAVVCVESSIPPSDKIGVISGQSEAEEIIPMREMKMAWVPYIPLDKRDKQVDRKKFPIFVLGCTQRRSALKHLKDDRVKKFSNCLPYINNPFKEGEPELSTVVQITFPSEPPVEREYDWEKNDLEEFTNDLIKDEALLQNKKDEFKEFVKEQCDSAKETYEKAKEALEKATEEMSEETKEAYNKMRLHKFYPVASPDTPDLSGIEKTSLINKYFGNAHEVL
ncbi:hypothetical protein Bca4012_036058 [Brassica carinata]